MVANNIDAETRSRSEKSGTAPFGHVRVEQGHLANLLLSMLGDRVEMAHSVEARHTLPRSCPAEYVNALPPSLKVSGIPTRRQIAPKPPSPMAAAGASPAGGSSKSISYARRLSRSSARSVRAHQIPILGAVDVSARRAHS